MVKDLQMTNYSVLMSVYKKEKPEYLRTAMNSMWQQTVPTDDFVLVCDGTLTPELDAVITEMESVYDRLHVIRYDDNRGLGKALDIGIEYCKNELIARMDSDDISLPDRCERQLALFENNELLSICSGAVSEFVGEKDNVVSVRAVPENQSQIVKQMRTRSAFNHPAVMYKKSEVLRCGGYGILKRKQDHDLFSRMMNMNCNAYNIQDTILLFRADENNLGRRKSWENCKSYIIAQWNILKRGHCSIKDFAFVMIAQCFFFIAPASLVDYVTKKYLRQ